MKLFVVYWWIRIYEFCFWRILKVVFVIFCCFVCWVCICWVIIGICRCFFLYIRIILLLIIFFFVVWVFMFVWKLLVVWFFGIFWKIICSFCNIFVECFWSIYIFFKFEFRIWFFFFFSGWFRVLINFEWIVKRIWFRNGYNFRSLFGFFGV